MENNLTLTVNNIFELVGVIGTLSFLAIATIDFFIASVDIVIVKFLKDSARPSAQKFIYVWGAIKDIYEEFRHFIDRLSAFSRPRGTPSSAAAQLPTPATASQQPASSDIEPEKKHGP